MTTRQVGGSKIAMLDYRTTLIVQNIALQQKGCLLSEQAQTVLCLLEDSGGLRFQRNGVAIRTLRSQSLFAINGSSFPWLRTMNLRDLLVSAAYRDYLCELESQLIGHPFNQDAPIRAVIVRLHEEWMGYAEVTPEALLGLIETERVQTIRYIAQKLTAYMEAEGGPDNIVNEPANLHMPIGHLIEYWLHRGEGPDPRNYLRKIRMPGATAYAKETAVMFRIARATDFSQ